MGVPGWREQTGFVDNVLYVKRSDWRSLRTVVGSSLSHDPLRAHRTVVAVLFFLFLLLFPTHRATIRRPNVQLRPPPPPPPSSPIRIRHLPCTRYAIVANITTTRHGSPQQFCPFFRSSATVIAFGGDVSVSTNRGYKLLFRKYPTHTFIFDTAVRFCIFPFVSCLLHFFFSLRARYT